MPDIVTLVSNLGFPIAVAIVLIGYVKQVAKEAVQREERMGQRIDMLENDVRDQLMVALAASTKAVERSTSVIDRSARIMEQIEHKL